MQQPKQRNPVTRSWAYPLVSCVALVILIGTKEKTELEAAPEFQLGKACTLVTWGTKSPEVVLRRLSKGTSGRCLRSLFPRAFGYRLVPIGIIRTHRGIARTGNR